MRMESTWEIRSSSQRTGGHSSSGRRILRQSPFSLARYSYFSYVSRSRVSGGTGAGSRFQEQASAPASCSMSSIRRDIRFPSSWIVSVKRAASSGAAFWEAVRQESITARGERSSWEAEAINWACCLRFSSRGARVLPVKNQKKTARRRSAALSAPRKTRRCP